MKCAVPYLHESCSTIKVRTGLVDEMELRREVVNRYERQFDKFSTASNASLLHD